MRFYTKQHPFYCGIDLHARTMYLCILDQAGETLLHRNMTATPEALLTAIAPYRDQIVLAAACMFTWYWLADLCAEHGIPFVLGHALSRKAIHGGKAKTDPLDAHKMAVLLRGGRLPQAYVSPADMRAPRDLLRRRTSLIRKRAELLAHLQNTNSQYNLPEIGKNWPTKPTATVSPSGSLIPPCRRAWKWTWRCLGPMTRCSASSSCLSSKRPSSTTPTLCICSRRCPASGTS